MYLNIDANGHVIQGAIRKMSKQRVPVAMSSSTIVLRFRGTLQVGEVDMRGCLGYIIRPSENSLVAWYDANSANTWSIVGGVTNADVVDFGAETVSISGTDASVEIGAF